MAKYPKIEITKDDLRKIIYFILMKFKGDPMHRQGTSAKRDLIGGYIERWFNKVAETVVFDDLLKGKNYRVVCDYFIYSNDSEKNAPDVLGLENKEVVPFVKYNNGTWETVPGMPRIEVKVVKEDQSLVSVREPQMNDDYYAFIESDLNGDYLSAIFEDKVFDEHYFNELKMSSQFIKNDIGNQIIPHSKVFPTERIGTMRLIGIYAKSELKENSVLCGRGVSPYYLGRVLSKSPLGRVRLNEKMILDKKGRFTYKYDDSHICLPVDIENPKNGEITLIKKNKGSVYINSTEDIIVGGVSISRGDSVIEFKKFDRSSGWNENILLKQILEKYGEDSTDELVRLFDNIMNR